AILEVLYSTGIRRMEVLGLSVFDLDAERRTLLVRQGKGKKDRMVPIGRRAIAWLERYLDSVRPSLVVPPDPGNLFLTSLGDEFSPHRLTQLVRLRGVGRDWEEGRVSSLPAHDGDHDARGRSGHPLHPGDAGARGAFDDADLHAGVDSALAGGAQCYSSRGT